MKVQSSRGNIIVVFSLRRHQFFGSQRTQSILNAMNGFNMEVWGKDHDKNNPHTSHHLPEVVWLPPHCTRELWANILAIIEALHMFLTAKNSTERKTESCREITGNSPSLCFTVWCYTAKNDPNRRWRLEEPTHHIRTTCKQLEERKEWPRKVQLIWGCRKQKLNQTKTFPTGHMGRVSVQSRPSLKQETD